MAQRQLDTFSRVRDTIARHDMIAPGQKVLAAVSGGADSMALFHLLLALGHDVEVAHLDHNTRDGASAEDADFVQTEAAMLDVPCHVTRCDVPREAAAAGQSFESHARSVRYTFLERVARERHCDVIATGHHGGDQAETVLLRLLRGTSPGGLGGIPPVRVSYSVKIVRPLIECSHAELVIWLRLNGLSWCEDHTNQDPHYARNRVRHELLPLLEGYNPAIRDALTRLADTQRCEDDFLDGLARTALSQCREDDTLNRAILRTLPEALQRRVLLAYAFALGATPEHDVLLGALRAITGDTTGKECDLGQGVRLYLGKSHAEPVASVASTPMAPIPLRVPDTVEALGHRISVRMLSSCPKHLDTYCNASRQVFDSAKLADTVIRTRQPGDVFRPLGMKGSKKLKDWLIDAGVPRPRRDARLVLAWGNEILWIVGGPPSVEAAVTEQTRWCLEVTIEHVD